MYHFNIYINMPPNLFQNLLNDLPNLTMTPESYPKILNDS